MRVQAKSARELRDLLSSPGFSEWADEYERLRARVRELRVVGFMQSGDAAVEMLFRAGEIDDLAAAYDTEYSEIENESVEALARYERQRMRATEFWIVAHAAEKRVEDIRGMSSELGAEVSAAKKNSPSDAQRLQDRLKNLERQRDELSATAMKTKEVSDREYAERMRLWGLVEDSWHRSLRASLARAEFAYQARLIRRRAESLLKRSAPEITKSEDLSEALADAERLYSEHIELGSQLFDSIIIDAFLYSPLKDDSRWVWCVPLINENNELNVQLVKHQIYRIQRGRALDYVEPVALEELEGAVEEDTPTREGDRNDPRLDAFFGATPSPR